MLWIAAATRLGSAEFGHCSPLARSVEALSNRGEIRLEVTFENAAPLADVFNRALCEAGKHDTVLFTHDDVRFGDRDLVRHLDEALARFDVVGVAGNRRRISKQGAWPFLDLKGTWDHPNLSGEVTHDGRVSHYGPAPQRVVLIDGLFIAAKAATLRDAGVTFDAAFPFHFYDMDFCRSCERAQLSVGTWPIAIEHGSGGSFGCSDWMLAYYRYLRKWGD